MTTQTFAFSHIVSRHLYLDGHYRVAAETIPDYLNMAEIEISRLDYDHAIGHLLIAAELTAKTQSFNLVAPIAKAIIQCSQGKRHLESKIAAREDSKADNRRARAEQGS